MLCDEFYTPNLIASGEKNSEIFGEFNKILYSADHMLICRDHTSRAHPYLQFTKAGLIPRRIGERIV